MSYHVDGGGLTVSSRVAWRTLLKYPGNWSGADVNVCGTAEHSTGPLHLSPSPPMWGPPLSTHHPHLPCGDPHSVPTTLTSHVGTLSLNFSLTMTAMERMWARVDWAASKDGQSSFSRYWLNSRNFTLKIGKLRTGQVPTHTHVCISTSVCMCVCTSVSCDAMCVSCTVR